MATPFFSRTALDSTDFGRGLDGFRSHVALERKPSGVAELDAMLGGGFPCGSVVEICGPSSSGRTSLGFSLLAQATGRQEACAFVDVSDSLDSLSAAAAGIDLTRLLWIRCSGEGEKELARRSFPGLSRAESGSKSVASAPAASRNKSPQCGGWRHPRDQIRGVETALPGLLSPQAVAPENAGIHVVARCAGEQVERDRQLPRRGEHIRPHLPANAAIPAAKAAGKYSLWTKPWKRLEQAIKTTDLLLHSGGWGVVVFDLGDISWVDARRIELSTWFRFRRTVENTPTLLLLLGEESCAKSCASLVLQCRRKAENWNSVRSSAGNDQAHVTTFQGFDVEGQVLRSRAGLQPGDSAYWVTHAF
jgi:recombination protein RecA